MRGKRKLPGGCQSTPHTLCPHAVEPITFIPLYMQRVWGGRELERIYGRVLPDAAQPYGESWEIVDRPHEQSIIDHGPLAGISLHELWTTRREEIFGEGYHGHPRFPILIKILDARNDLSIQVHPPVDRAHELGGEPKTEMWFIADCEPGAKLYVGLKRGVSRADFQQAIADGGVAQRVHAIEPQPGDAIFIPSGRLHAIGAGFLIHEIQQNSDTTYRIFDWNRAGLDGKSRELHVPQSLASIDFVDIEPTMDTPVGDNLATCPYFKTDRKILATGQTLANPEAGKFSILSIVKGALASNAERGRGPLPSVASIVKGALASNAGRHFPKGRTLLLPRDAPPLRAVEESVVLQITLPFQM
jgi:mannose-6-phosphate isomerase